MLEYIVLGIIQGMGEWVPISSDGLIILARTHLFGNPEIAEGLRIALILHLGTFFSALIYFRKEVRKILSELFQYSSLERGRKVVINFYIIATVLSGVLGFLILKIIEGAEDIATTSAKGVTLIIALSLLVTGILLLSRKRKRIHVRREDELTITDSLLTGGIQGLAALPGVSRSGGTVSVLLLRHFDEKTALTLSFMLSLPIVLFANIFLSYEEFLTLNLPVFAGILAAFVTGYLTIHAFMKIAEKVDFARFVLGFAVLLLLSLLI